MPTRITDAKGLGAAIRTARKAQGLTQKELADFFSSFSREFLSDLENGKPTVELERALAVVNALGLRLNISDATNDAAGVDGGIKR
ncbi:MAG: helix-turn-helix domain-containing protein [Coriobacteriales bacterium]|jgi:transcriptional regulator with XRE-family HTH domain|nr:helix-turn-helix domain-containing protein [Coriobacteriales bacterium]